MINKNNIEEILPLLPLQSSMLNTAIMSKDCELYKEINCFTLEKHIDNEKVREAWEYVVKGNEVLRTVFRWKHLSNPVQIILKEMELDYDYEDCQALSDGEFDKHIEELCNEKLNKSMDLEGKLFHVSLIEKSNAYAVLIVENHHILFDGWSSAIMMSEFIRIYTSLVNGIPVELDKKESYVECVVDIVSRRKAFNQEFWKSYLPKGYENKQKSNQLQELIKMGDKKISSYVLNEEMLSYLEESAKKNKVTVAVYYYLAWAVLLNIIMGKELVVFGITFSGRMDNTVDCMSLLINTLPFIITIKDEDSIEKKLYEVRQLLNELQENRRDSLVEVYRTSKELPVIQYDAIIVLQNYPVDKNINGNQLMPLHIRKRYYKSDIDLNLSVQFFEKIQCEFEFNIQKFSLQDIDQYAAKFQYILESMESCKTILELKQKVTQLGKKEPVVELKEFDF